MEPCSKSRFYITITKLNSDSNDKCTDARRIALDANKCNDAIQINTLVNHF